jgi:predicted amidohydrolase YtcJ
MFEMKFEAIIRTTRAFLRLALTASLLGGIIACTPPPDSKAKDNSSENFADLVLTGGKVYSMNETNASGKPTADAIAVKDGMIAAVGSFDIIKLMIGEATKVLDMSGTIILPGLVDSHTHVPELGASLTRINLTDIKTEAEAVEIIAARAAKVPAGEWIIGQGWDEGAWANHYPDLTLISERVPDNPVFMRSLHGFAGWANQLALNHAGITRDTKTPSGGEIGHFDNGEPDGLFLNRAVKLLDDTVPTPGREELKRQIVAGLEQMARDGYVTVHDAGLDTELMLALEELEAENRLPIRVYAMLSARDAELSEAWIAKGPDTDNDSMLVTRAVKAYYDGALGSRGAKMLEDYSDAPGHRGLSGSEYGFDEDLVARLVAKGFQIGVHAIGDAGNRDTLDFYQRVFVKYPGSQNNRHRIEHAQIIHPDDLPRLAQMNIIASMEPPHAVEDKTWAEARVGAKRIEGAYAWRSLKESGAIVIFNADNPGSDHSIFYGLHSAITRQDKSSKPEGGWYPEEAFTIEETMHAYTTLPAYASFRENETGVLETGRWADITVLDIDPFELAESRPAKILEGKVVMTIVSGKIVYHAD